MAPTKMAMEGTQTWLLARDLEMAPPEWGREISGGDVRRIAAEFDPDAFGVIAVWERLELPIGGGRWIVLDGQHRVRAVVDLLGYGDQKVPCVVYRGLTAERGAAISKHLQNRRPLTIFDGFRTSLAAGEPWATDIDKILHDNGLMFGRGTRQDGVVLAIARVTHIYQRLGPQGVDRVCKLIISAWGGLWSSLVGDMFKTVEAILCTHPTINDAKFAVTLRSRLPDVWLADLRVASKRKPDVGVVAFDMMTRYRQMDRTIEPLSPSAYITAMKKQAGPTSRTRIQGRVRPQHRGTARRTPQPPRAA